MTTDPTTTDPKTTEPGSAAPTTAVGDVIVGVGMSSKATAAEVRALIDDALRGASLEITQVVAVATRERFAADVRLPAGIPVEVVDDETLVAASPPTTRALGIAAQVASTAAIVTAERLWGSARILGHTHRSAHATAAICRRGDHR